MKAASLFPILILMVPCFLGVNGYHYGIGDQAHYIPIIERTIDPKAFPNDYLFDQLSGEYTLWVPLVAFLGKFFDLQWVFFIGFLVALLGFVLANYALALALLPSKGAAILAVFFAIVCKEMGATTASTLENHFHLRVVAMPLAIGFLASFVAGRYKLAAALCAFCFLVHPIIALAPTSILFFYLLVNARQLGWATITKTLGIFLILSLPLVVKIFSYQLDSSSLGFFTVVSDEWISIIRHRNWYIFYSNWSRRSWLYLMPYAVLLVLGILVKRRLNFEEGREHRVVWVMTLALLWLGIGYVFVEKYPVSFIIQMQVARNLYLLIGLAKIYAAHLLWLAFVREQASILTRVLAVLGTVIFLLQKWNMEMLVLSTGIILLLWMPSLMRLFSDQTKLIDTRFLIHAASFLLLGFIFWRRQELLQSLDHVKLTGAILVAFFLGESLHRVVLPQNALLQKATKLLTLPSLAAFTLVLVAWPTWYALAFDHQTFLQRINLPHRLPADSWRDVQQWIAENTPADAVFFVPPDTRAFRIYAKRSSVVDWKDGAPSVFSERYAKTWWERMTRLQGYENLGAQEWRELAARYRASFLVARANSPLQFPKPYDNGAFAVYLITNDGVSPH